MTSHTISNNDQSLATSYGNFADCLAAVESALSWSPAKDFEVRYLTSRIEENGEIFMEMTSQGMLYIVQTGSTFTPTFRPLS